MRKAFRIAKKISMFDYRENFASWAVRGVMRRGVPSGEKIAADGFYARVWVFWNREWFRGGTGAEQVQRWT
jgi:hypothetical protein